MYSSCCYKFVQPNECIAVDVIVLGVLFGWFDASDVGIGSVPG